jgi:hypothetical protein
VKRWRILIIIVTVLFAGWIALHLAGEREPRFQGRRLADWLDQYGTNRWSRGHDGELQKEAETAIHQIGTNGIPIYLKMIADRGSLVKMKLLTNTPRSWLTTLHIPPLGNYQHQLDDRRRLGAYGFAALGQEATPGVPGLIALLKDNHYDVRYCSVFALRCLGPVASNALPALLVCLKDPDATVRDDAVTALGEIHQQPERVIPILAQFLKTNRSNIFVHMDTLVALGKFGADAKPAVPAILDCVEDIDQDVKAAALQALSKIDPSAETFLPVLLEMFRDSKVETREKSARYLGELFPVEAEKAGVFKEFPGVTIFQTNRVSTNAAGGRP